MDVRLPFTNCGIATYPNRAIGMAGLSPARLRPCRPLPKTPVVTCILAISHAGLLPSAACKASAFSCVAGIILTTTTIHFSELNTEPAPLIHPASDSRCRAYPWTSLLTCWLSSNQVGLSRHKVRNHPLGGNNQFHGITPNPKVSDLPWHEHYLVI